MSGTDFARYVVLDGLVHGWDLTQATGAAYDPDPGLVEAAHHYAAGALDPLRDGVSFRDAVEPAPGASPIGRLAALTGRHPLAVTR